MNRREAICAFLAVATLSGMWPARAQVNKAKPFRISTFPDFLYPDARDWFMYAMRKLGRMEERDFVILPSAFQLGERGIVDEVAKRVVADKPDLALTVATGNALALHRATPSIPIVAIGF